MREHLKNWIIILVVAVSFITMATAETCDSIRSGDTSDDSGWIGCYKGGWPSESEFGGATYIWPTYLADLAGEVHTYSRTFDIQGNPTEGILKIWVDDFYDLYVNGNLVGSGGYDYGIQSWTVTGYLNPDENTIMIDARNRAGGDTTWNPAGLIYQLDFCWNTPPNAAEDAYATNEDTALTVPAPGVLGNDNDPDGEALTATIVTSPSDGTATLNLDGSFVYEPNENFNGEDSFMYEASDGKGSTDIAIVDITVNPVNDAPVAVDDEATTDENTMVEVNVLANDADPDVDDALTITSVTNPSHGTAITNGEIVTYQPELWYSGDDQFDYTIADIAGSTATATVTITVVDVIPSPEDICAYIEALPDEAFDKDAGNQKNALCNKLAEVSNKIASKEYTDAINKLENDIRSKADGNDQPKDWITDPDAQSELCEMIDTLLDALKAQLVDYLPPV